jgi:hypothetical protein
VTLSKKRPHIIIGGLLSILAFAILAILDIINISPEMVAMAHAPILLTRRNTMTLTAPTVLDGRVSFAFYGVIDEPKAERYLRVVLPEKSDLFLELLLPDLDPEKGIPPEHLPAVSVTAPSGETTVHGAHLREPFYEEFTYTSYITYMRDRRPVEEGVYLLKVTGDRPSRFCLAVGYDEDRLYEAHGLIFGAHLAPNEDLDTWYRTPPPSG